MSEKELNLAIKVAWKEYTEIDGDFTYHLMEGGDSKYTREQDSEAWIKLNDLIKRLE